MSVSKSELREAIQEAMPALVEEVHLSALRLGKFSIRPKDDGMDTPAVREWLDGAAAQIRTAHNAAHAIGKFLRWCNTEAP